MLGASKLAAVTATCVLAAAGCATLPNIEQFLEQRSAQHAKFENARGPLSARQSAAVLAGLKRKAGTLDILEKHIAVEQAIVGSPLILGNKVTLLQDGAATYAAMFAAIRKARDHINLETYIIEADEIGQQFADLLLEQQRRGVQVNIIYDSVGAFNTPKAFFEPLKASGVGILEFNPVNPLNVRRQWMINHRDHRKLLIVDGRTAFIGGINISSVYSAGSVVRPPAHATSATIPWRDTQVHIEGPVVAELQKQFMKTWEKQHGKPLVPKEYFPRIKVQGNEIVRAIGSTPDDPYSVIYLTLLSAIGSAEKYVYLTNAYFVPDPQLVKAMMDAAGRGVDVKLILPSHSDFAATLYAGRSHYSTLLEAGVKIYERRGALLHSKTAVIDGVWSTVGSTNLDWRSFLDNDEMNVVILGREFAQKMEAVFARDLQASEAIDPEHWERRPLSSRLKEWMARMWERLL